MERWDAYRVALEAMEGRTLVRGDDIPQDCYHLVCEVLVRHRDGSYLLMQRDPRKRFGGQWEATAGGSALQGETPLDCARRELLEETGIAAGELRELGRVVCEENRSVYVDFLCLTDWDKQDVRLQAGETSAYRWASAEEIARMGRDELVTKRMQVFVDELRP